MEGVGEFNLLRVHKLGHKVCFVGLCIVMQESKVSNACFRTATCGFF